MFSPTIAAWSLKVRAGERRREIEDAFEAQGREREAAKADDARRDKPEAAKKP